MIALPAFRCRCPGDPYRSRPGRTRGAPALLAGLALLLAGPALGADPGPDPAALPAGAVFRDCPGACPAMVVLPAGRFLMGAAPGEEAGDGMPDHLQGTAEPRHQVTIAYRLAVGVAEISTDDWLNCLADGGCRGYRPKMPWGNGAGPAIFISWEQAGDYLAWLGRRTGQPYRLLTEAEWEYAARAGTTTAWPWGAAAGRDHANCDGCLDSPDRQSPMDPSRFPANRFGLRNLPGNVWEWVADCYRPDYQGAPADGSAILEPGCRRRVLRGGSWISPPWTVRSAARAGFPADRSFEDTGFRVARTLAAAPAPPP